jgi:small multidrug resistance pump
VRNWLLLLAAIACEVTASLSLKGALDSSPLYVVVVVGYLGSFVLLDAVLRRGLPLGVAYGVWGAFGVAATATLSAAIYDEPVTGLMGIGIALVISGVLVVELSSHRAKLTVEEP